MDFRDLASKIGSFFQNLTQPPPSTQPQGNFVGTKFGNVPFQGPVGIQRVQAASPAPVTTPTPTQQPSQDLTNLGERIRAGYREYNHGQPVPMEQYIPQMVQASQQYPIFKQNPFLIPAVSMVETSAGKNWQLNHNPLSWAARVQQAGDYNPQTDLQSIQDMITAVGGDPNRGAGYTGQEFTNRQGAIAPYQKFRSSNNLQDFATTYESKDNTAYYPALQDALKHFK